MCILHTQQKYKQQQHMLQTVLRSIRNHWAMMVPLFFARYAMSNYTAQCATYMHMTISMVHMLHAATDVLLIAATVYLVYAKFYLQSKQVQRPFIPSDLIAILVRNHWLGLTALFTGQLWIRNSKSMLDRFGMHSSMQFQALADAAMFMIALVLFSGKLYLLANVESLSSQLHVPVEQDRTSIKEKAK